MDFHIECQVSGDLLRCSTVVASAFRRDENDDEGQPSVAKHCLPTGLAVGQRWAAKGQRKTLRKRPDEI
ncbi:MAG TPA: hypothetical protein VMA30_17890 [Xanthobacteraceae bacterium]|nr:hypothetical protein [Xanthobacteraceae bacterium]